MFTAKELKENMLNNSLKDLYKNIELQAIDMLALEDKDFRKTLGEKVLYSIKTKQLADESKLDSDMVLKAIVAHEDYLLSLKHNKIEIEKNIIKIAMSTFNKIEVA